MPTLPREDDEFYGGYRWTLDPMPRWRETARRLREELRRWQESVTGWQEKELALNCWLLASGLWQAINDHYVRDAGLFEPLLRRQGAGRAAALAAQALVQLRNRAADRAIAAKDDAWRALLKKLARTLIDERPARGGERQRLCRDACGLLDAEYPGRLLAMRIRVPAAFRTQDLTHHDFVSLATQYAVERRQRYNPVVIVGLRTAGAYAVSLAHAVLEGRGVQVAGTAVLRPSDGLSPQGRELLARGDRQNADVVVVAGPPRTGDGIAGALRLLERQGICRRRVSLLFPVYPSHERWKNASWMRAMEGPQVITLPWNRWHLAESLNTENVRRLLTDHYAGRGLQLVGVEESEKTKCVDARFGTPERIGWRLKQVYRLRLWDGEGREIVEDVLAKSVGWGWLGYHALLQAAALKEFVPQVLGLSSGLLFMCWIDGNACMNREEDAERLVPHALRYILARRERLGLGEDITFREDAGGGRAGGRFLCAVLSRPFGRALRPLIRPLLSRLLRRYAAVTPALVDGRLAPSEWIEQDGRFYKVDYEHHAFGEQSLNVTDPVFDLASFIFEFRLGERQRERLVAEYAARTGESAVREKVLLYLWLIAHFEIARRRDYFEEPYAYRRSVEENRKYISDMEYGNLVALQYFGKLSGGEASRGTASNCFVLNIDGLLDHDTWDFPTMTPAGVRSVALLQAHGFRVFLNSGRSCGEVRAYCEQFGLEGGVAEYGGVLWDGRSHREIELLDDQARESLAAMRRAVLQFPDIYINPHYRCVIRAFYRRDRCTAPVEEERLARIMEQAGAAGLAILPTRTDTVVTARSVDKGTGMQALFENIAPRTGKVIALGSSERDIPAFRRADLSFVPEYLLRERRDLRSLRNVFPVSGRPEDILSAVRAAVRRYGTTGTPSGERKASFDDQVTGLLLRTADRSGLGRLLTVLEAIRN